MARLKLKDELMTEHKRLGTSHAQLLDFVNLNIPKLYQIVNYLEMYKTNNKLVNSQNPHYERIDKVLDGKKYEAIHLSKHANFPLSQPATTTTSQPLTRKQQRARAWRERMRSRCKAK